MGCHGKTESAVMIYATLMCITCVAAVVRRGRLRSYVGHLERKRYK